MDEREQYDARTHARTREGAGRRGRAAARPLSRGLWVQESASVRVRVSTVAGLALSGRARRPSLVERVSLRDGKRRSLRSRWGHGIEPGNPAVSTSGLSCRGTGYLAHPLASRAPSTSRARVPLRENRPSSSGAGKPNPGLGSNGSVRTRASLGVPESYRGCVSCSSFFFPLASSSVCLPRLVKQGGMPQTPATVFLSAIVRTAPLPPTPLPSRSAEDLRWTERSFRAAASGDRGTGPGRRRDVRPPKPRRMQQERLRVPDALGEIPCATEPRWGVRTSPTEGCPARGPTAALHRRPPCPPGREIVGTAAASGVPASRGAHGYITGVPTTGSRGYQCFWVTYGCVGPYDE